MAKSLDQKKVWPDIQSGLPFSVDDLYNSAGRRLDNNALLVHDSVGVVRVFWNLLNYDRLWQGLANHDPLTDLGMLFVYWPQAGEHRPDEARRARGYGC